MYWVEISGDKITGKGNSEFKTKGQVEIAEEIYNLLTTVPATYTIKDNKIISVSPIKVINSDVIKKTETIEEKIVKLENRISELERTQSR